MLYQAMQEQYGLLFWMDELFPILFQTTQGGAFAVHRRLPWMSVISLGMSIWSQWK